jgi:hypothetical protein
MAAVEANGVPHHPTLAAGGVAPCVALYATADIDTARTAVMCQCCSMMHRHRAGGATADVRSVVAQ